MTSSVERKLLVAEAEAVIQAGSKSFRLASRLFDRTTRQRAWLLYAWCRHCDDLSDGQSLGHGAHPPADPEARLALIRDCTARALAGERTGSVPFDALGRAADLGIAIQLANIARDIVDDARVGRSYIPTDWTGCDLDPLDPAQRPRLVEIAQRLSTLANRYRASSKVGAARLPFRSRWAVLSAAAIYGEVATRAVQLGPKAWDRRISISKAEKFALVARAYVEALLPVRKVSREGLWTRPPNTTHPE